MENTFTASETMAAMDVLLKQGTLVESEDLIVELEPVSNSLKRLTYTLLNEKTF